MRCTARLTSSATAAERGWRSFSSSSMEAVIEGLDFRTSSCSLLMVLPWETASSSWIMRLCFLRRARIRLLMRLSTGPSAMSEAAVAAIVVVGRG